MLGAAAVGLLALGTRRRTPAPRTKTPNAPATPNDDEPVPPRARPPVPEADVEFSAYAFPPPRADKDWDRLRVLAATAERETGMRNLYSFLLAVARTESSGRASAMNTATDAKPAFSLFCRDQNFERRYAHNPWRPEACTPNSPGAARWAYSGGWFQIMPATALATADKRGHTHDPARVFDPPFAVAYAVDLAARIARNYSARTWGDVRAGWALPRWAKPSSTAVGKARNQENFRRSAAALSHLGVTADIDRLAVKTSSYPGFTHVLHALLAAEGRTQAGNTPAPLASGLPEPFAEPLPDASTLASSLLY